MSENEWSVPASAVYRGARDRLADGAPAVLATVVDVEGSAYRRPGAKMLVDPDGSGVGHITAGCLESEVAALARDVLAADEPRIETYDLMEDDDDVWGMGVGCNGVVDILLEPLGESMRPAVDAYHGGDGVAVVTVLEGDLPTGARFHYRPEAGVVRDDGAAADWVVDAVADSAAALLSEGKSDTVPVETDGGTATVFVDGVTAPPDLVVVGTGHDVGPVVELGRKNDFRTTVAGFRGAADLDDRFGDADRTVTTSPPALAEALDADDETYVVVMTHNFVDDRLAVEALLETETQYVGLMGPHERFEEMLDEFEAEGRTFDDDDLRRVYTPVGLDLGVRSPYQIATSIVSEVLAVHAGRTPRHLREREGDIHERVDLAADDD
jgi:xanthine dehydrogenase accessory factor